MQTSLSANVADNFLIRCVAAGTGKVRPIEWVSVIELRLHGLCEVLILCSIRYKVVTSDTETKER